MDASHLQAEEPGENPSFSAQAISFGQWQLAFTLAWTTQVVEQFALSNIPRAPLWLMGCSNIEGVVVPVVDLQAYIHSQEPQNMLQQMPHRHQRLLVGAVSRQSIDDTLAIAFYGLPAQVHCFRAPLDSTQRLPLRLRNICAGWACCADGRRFLEIDTLRLCETLVQHALQD